jgi:hypothetical protein
MASHAAATPRDRSPSLDLRVVERLVRLANARPARRASRRLIGGLLAVRGALPTAWIGREVRQYLHDSSTCCEKGSAHNRFAERFLKLFGERTFRQAERFLEETPPRQAAARVDAWARIALLGELRSHFLFRRRGSNGVPAALLHQAQLALYPHCDLGCEGCFTEEERTGKAPRKEQIAWLIDEAALCGAGVIHIVGKGEPFLSPSWAAELLDVLEANPHLFFTLATHGMHITPAQAARLAGMGNVLTLVSVDGPRELHDARRGAGSHERVMGALALLREHGALFGYSCMVSAKSWQAVSTASWVGELAAAGCAVGVHSRYFPLSPGRHDELALSPQALASYRAAFDATRDSASIALLDLDDIEQHSGCHSRTGESVYIDGITGAVTPCLRVPFGPDDCKVDRAAGRRLGEVLSHPFFVEYRARTGPCPSWCGADLAGELADVERILEQHGGATQRLAGYRERSPSTDGSPGTGEKRRLPLVSRGA